MPMDLATVDELLTTTRAVRRHLDLERPVPHAVIVECLRLSTQAPSAADAQNWRWLVLTEAGQRRRITDIHRSGSEQFVRDQVANLDDGSERRRMASALHLLEHLHEVPVHVLAYVLDPHLEGLGGEPVPPALLYGSVYPAVWSFQLALRSRGLGTTPVFVVDEAAVAEVVGAPPGAHLASLLPVAYDIRTSSRPAARRPVEEVVHWERWPAGDPGASRPR